ncbi:MAG: hypothetical protein FJX36_04955 [Alphaproteobacteria bacterium]|nr:hypothetical protein [Alphaproteobacteria bacterium]
MTGEAFTAEAGPVDAAQRCVDALLSAHPGPALLLDDYGRPRMSNAAAAAMGPALSAGRVPALAKTARRGGHRHRRADRHPARRSYL